MTADAPKWINDAFFAKVLKSRDGDKDLKVVDYTVTNHSKSKTESQIFRVSVNYSSKFNKSANASFVLKTPPTCGSAESESGSYYKEAQLYNTVMTEMQRLLKHAGEDTQIAPNTFYYSADQNPVIVLEDVTKRGYSPMDGLLDLDATKVVLAKLAKWHATSYFMGESTPAIKTANSGLFNIKHSEVLFNMQDNVKVFTEVLKSWNDTSLYVEKFERIQKEFFKMGEQIFTPNKAGFNVLNHGECSFRNMFQKRDPDQVISDVIFVDFKLSVWGTPAIDLLNVLYLVASNEVRTKYRTELVKFYYSCFTDTLRRIGYLNKMPSLLELQLELLKNGFLEVIIAVCMLPFLNTDSPIETAAEKMELFNNPDYQNAIKELLPYFLTKGFLE